MYSRCLFCHARLGRNEAVEAFPVGRRLAFDAARGRLWVVCPACTRWNLSPLESRFEAVEACERAYRGTRLRASTEQIGLARLRDGTELVRVGRPLRPEFAAWRYGDAFTRRRRRWLARRAIATSADAATTAALGGAFATFGPIAVLGTVVVDRVREYVERRRVAALVRDDRGRWLLVRPAQVDEAVLEPADGGAWRLSIRHSPALHPTRNADVVTSRLTGDAARAALVALLPAVNASGGERDIVGLAVQRIELARDPARYVEDTLARTVGQRRLHRDPPLALVDVVPSVRLALEMATHEEAERRALEGELAALEAAWRDAEAVARIADDLLLPEPVQRALERLRAARRLPDRA